jgi:hypothetical protein
MNGIKLTIAQKNSIQGVFYNENTFFNCVKEVEIIDNFNIKEGSYFEIKTQ